jgi:hypothetical protein
MPYLFMFLVFSVLGLLATCVLMQRPATVYSPNVP